MTDQATATGPTATAGGDLHWLLNQYRAAEVPDRGGRSAARNPPAAGARGRRSGPACWAGPEPGWCADARRMTWG